LWASAQFRYNQASHPLAFQKASAVVATKGGKKARPDVEDAFEDSDDGEVVEDATAEEEEDLSKDKMIREKTAKGKGGAAAKKAAPKKAKK
jgi:replication factor C subunit 1